MTTSMTDEELDRLDELADRAEEDIVGFDHDLFHDALTPALIKRLTAAARAKPGME